MTKTSGVLCGLLALILCLPAAVQAQGFIENPAYSAARGPVALRDMRPYNLLFLQFMPETGETLPARANRYGLQFDVANNLLAPNPSGGATVFEDNEYQRLQFSYRHGFGRQWELGAFASLEWRDAGFLDGVLQGWHDFWGISGNADDNPVGRGNLPQNKSHLILKDATGNTLVNQGNGFGLGETTLTLKKGLITQNRRSALAVRLGVKIPTGNPTLLLGSGNLDAGLSLDAKYSVGRDIILYANLGGVVMGHASHVPGAQSTVQQVFTGLEYRPNNRDSFLLQVDGNSIAVKTGNGFADRAQVTLTVGYKRVLDRHLVGFIAFAENGDIHNYQLTAVSSIGPDVTFSGGLEWHP